MADLPDEVLRQERRSLPHNQQAYTARRIQALIDDPEDPALIVGPIRFRRDPWSRLSGGSAFVVPAGVELLVERNGQISQVLREGRFNAFTWEKQDLIRFFLVRTRVRSLRISFDAETDGPQPTLRAVKLNYRVGVTARLIEHDQPVSELYMLARARLQPALYLATQAEAVQKVEALLAALVAAPELGQLGFVVTGGVIEQWSSPLPAGAKTLEVLSDQVATLQRQGLVVDFREERGTYYIVVPLVAEQNDNQTLMIYCACTPQYPLQPPVVFVRRWDGGEEHYAPPLLTSEWSARNTLSQIIDAVKRDYTQP